MEEKTAQVWQFCEIPQSLQDLLVQMYGPQPISDDIGYSANRIETIRELDAEEQKIFSDHRFMSANFVTQALYKLCGVIVPTAFNRAVRDLVERSDILRTNYCPIGQKTLAVIFRERNEMPSIVYQNLRSMGKDEQEKTLHKIMDADMGQAFNLKHDNLIRFIVFRTGENEYAILVTAIYSIYRNLSLSSLFADAQGIAAEKTETKIVPFSPPDDQFNQALKNYWAKILANLPAKSPLPYARPKPDNRYRRQVYRMTLPRTLVSDLRGLARNNKMMLMALLQAAWALLLHEYGKNRDVAFCSLVASTSGKMDGLNMLPVRLKLSDDKTIESLVEAHFKQLVVSKPYSRLGWDEMREVLGTYGFFDHFLSFFDFADDGTNFADAEADNYGRLVTQHSWDAQSSGLGIYFNYEDHRLSLSFMFNEGVFLPFAGEMMAQDYRMTLQHMVNNWYMSMADFFDCLTERLHALGESIQERDKAYIQNATSVIKVLQGSGTGIWQLFAQSATARTLFEGDRIADEELRENLIFVSEGRLERSLETADGWYNTLDVLKTGDWVNESALLPESKARIAVTVLTEQAVVLQISVKAMQGILATKPQFWSNIVTYILTQMEKYQKLWIMS